MNRHEEHEESTSSGAIGDVECVVRGNVVVARMTGEVDLSNAERIGGKVAAAVPGGAFGVVLDLTLLTYLDSAGIYVIYGLRQRLSETGQGLILVVPERGQVHSTLTMANVTDQVPATRTVEDALHALHAVDRSPTTAQ
jgi:anti-sigma B factor antagonist